MFNEKLSAAFHAAIDRAILAQVRIVMGQCWLIHILGAGAIVVRRLILQVM